jgi:hypothetical protein
MTDRHGVFRHIEAGVHDLDVVPVPDPSLLRPMDEAARTALQDAVDRHRAQLGGEPASGLGSGGLPQRVEIWEPGR